jgi:hypothetical protein
MKTLRKPLAWIDFTTPQKVALRHPCYFASETAHPRFGRELEIGMTLIVTVETGDEAMRFGGPVWHACALPQRMVGREFIEQTVRLALMGVGDASLGEWREWTEVAVDSWRRAQRDCVVAAYRIRRRLAEAECALGEVRVGGARLEASV